MKIRRDVSALPVRTGEMTWRAITTLVTGRDSKDVEQLEAITGMMAALIADEQFLEHALVLRGVGHRLVVYCRYGADAVIEGAQIDSLTWNPTAGDWTLQVPCSPGDLDWVRKYAAGCATRVVVHAIGEEPLEEAETKSDRSGDLEVDWNAVG